MKLPKGIVLRLGSQGRWVRVLQEHLITCGYYVGPAGADGVFGPATDAAVRYFQSINELDIDGKVGPKTAKALDDCVDSIAEARKQARKQKVKDRDFSSFIRSILRAFSEFPWLDFVQAWGDCLKKKGHGLADVDKLINCLKALRRPTPSRVLKCLLVGGIAWADLINCFFEAQEKLRKRAKKRK